MILTHGDFDTTLQISPEKTGVLTIEDEALFYKYSEELYSQTNGEYGQFILSENGRELSLTKNLLFIFDYFTLPVTDKKWTASLYRRLQQLTEEKFLLDMTEIKSQIGSLLEKLNAESDYPLDFETDVGVAEIFKIFGVKLYVERETLLTKLVSFVRAAAAFDAAKCICFLNLKRFLSRDDLTRLYKEARLSEISLLLLEQQLKEKLDNEINIVIDKDFCEIVV